VRQTDTPSPRIHPTAVIDRRVELGRDVEVGPYAVIEGRVTIGDGTRIGSHSVIHGHAIIGAHCRIGPAAYVGLDAQHLHIHDVEAWCVVGDNTVIRESASVHRATRPGLEHATRVGNRCFMMGSTHVAHDCVVEDDVIMANAALLGGHCHVGARAFIGGASAIHQHCRVGRLAIIAGNESVSHDVPPFAAVRYGGLKGYNAVGCRRAGFPQKTLHAIRASYHCLHTRRTAPAALDAMRAIASDSPEVRELHEFIASARRGIPPSVRFLGRIRHADGEWD
jgi:UDP-N-acetylglucosamine acyltransferase